MTREKHSKAMTIANRLVGQGYSRPAAMIKAWMIVKLARVETKVVGVTFGRRQEAIERLTHYAPQRVTISLKRDSQNPHDVNAIAVVATVSGKGSYIMGYVPRMIAAFVAPLLDAGKAVKSVYRDIFTPSQPHMSYGLTIGIAV